MKPVRVSVTRVLRYVSNRFEVSTAFRFLANHRHGTDRRTEYNTSSARYKCILAARRQTSNNARSLLVLYFGDI